MNMKRITIILLLLIPLIGISQKRVNRESYYQDMFSNKLINDNIPNSKEVSLKDRTRCDIVTNDYAIEVDFANKWAEAIGQSLHYALLLNKKPSILLILESVKDVKYLNRLLVSAKKYNITVWTVTLTDKDLSYTKYTLEWKAQNL